MFEALTFLTRAEVSRLQYLRPSTGFREQAQYNNHMYTVLAYLPQVLLNTTYEKYVHDNIITPLGMDATTYFYVDAVKTGRLADGFFRQDANLTDDPFAEGTVRALPFWDQSTKGHRKFHDHSFADVDLTLSFSFFRQWRSHIQCARHGIVFSL
jgi:CubicO group peptidase (beta-lactamase class C family)